MNRRKKHLKEAVAESLRTLDQAFADLHERLDAIEAARVREYSREDVIEEVIRRLALVRRKDSAISKAGETAVRELVADLLSLDVPVGVARDRFVYHCKGKRSRSSLYDAVRDIRMVLEEVLTGKPPRRHLTTPITSRGTARRSVASK